MIHLHLSGRVLLCTDWSMYAVSIVSHDGGRHQKQTVTLAPNFSPAKKSASLWRPVMLSACPRPRYIPVAYPATYGVPPPSCSFRGTSSVKETKQTKPGKEKNNKKPLVNYNINSNQPCGGPGC